TRRRVGDMPSGARTTAGNTRTRRSGKATRTRAGTAKRSAVAAGRSSRRPRPGGQRLNARTGGDRPRGRASSPARSSAGRKRLKDGGPGLAGLLAVVFAVACVAGAYRSEAETARPPDTDQAAEASDAAAACRPRPVSAADTRTRFE